MTTAAAPAIAQAKPTVLKWAHVYEVSEPYHTEALWAAEEIKKRTDGKYEVQVFPASQLGNEPQINEALGLGTVDIIYTGAAFVGGVHKPLSISNAPYIFRDFDHWKAYRASKLFQGLAAGYGQRTGHSIVALTYYGERHLTSNKEIKGPDDLKGMKLRVPQAPLYVLFAKIYGANPTPIAFAEVYLALQQGTVDGQENPLPTILAKKFYEVQKYIHLTGHITESLVTVLGRPMLGKLDAKEQSAVRRGAHAGRIEGHGCHPRVRAEAARGVREARQGGDAPRSRGLPQGRDPGASGPRGARLLDQGAVRAAAGADVGFMSRARHVMIVACTRTCAEIRPSSQPRSIAAQWILGTSPRMTHELWSMPNRSKSLAVTTRVVNDASQQVQHRSPGATST